MVESNENVQTLESNMNEWFEVDITILLKQKAQKLTTQYAKTWPAKQQVAMLKISYNIGHKISVRNAFLTGFVLLGEKGSTHIKLVGER